MAKKKLCPTCGFPLPVTEEEFDRPILCAGCNGMVSPLVAPTADRTDRRDDYDEDEDDRPRRRRRDDYDDEDDEYDDGPPRPRRRAEQTGPNGKATASLVLGIIAILCSCFCGLMDFGFSLTGLILGIVSRNEHPANRRTATTGIILNVIAMILTVAFVVVWLGFNIFMAGGGGGGGGGWF